MTNANVEALQSLLNWHAPAAPYDWESLNAAVGVAYPDEFRMVVEAFPPGRIQSGFEILHPGRFANPVEYRREIAGYAGIVRDRAADLAKPMAVYPQPGGLLPWATVGLGPIVCWLTEGKDPQKWPVVVCPSAVERWNRYELSTAEFLQAVVTVPPSIVELAYVAEAVQPPVFKPMNAVPGARGEAPGAEYWLDGVPDGPLPEPVNAVADLRALVHGAPVPGFDWTAVLRRMKRALPPDFRRLLSEFGAVTVGPATVSAPDGSAHDFFAEMRRLSDRVKAERAAGGGPLGTVHPESDGLIPWGRLDGGGYLCWVPLPEDEPEDWPVAVLDETLRFSVTYKMSASRFLLEVATHPERILLPPAG
jgi:hypothetical protein